MCACRCEPAAYSRPHLLLFFCCCFCLSLSECDLVCVPAGVSLKRTAGHTCSFFFVVASAYLLLSVTSYVSLQVWAWSVRQHVRAGPHSLPVSLCQKVAHAAGWVWRWGNNWVSLRLNDVLSVHIKRMFCRLLRKPRDCAGFCHVGGSFSSLRLKVQAWTPALSHPLKAHDSLCRSSWYNRSFNSLSAAA